VGAGRAVGGVVEVGEQQTPSGRRVGGTRRRLARRGPAMAPPSMVAEEAADE
jgi:hypothetical protein